MTLPTLAAIVPWLTAGAAATTIAASRLRREQRPIAAALGFAALSNPLRKWMVATYVLPVQQAERLAGLDPSVVPLRGVARAALHFDHAAFVAWPAVIAALVVWYFLGRRPWPVIVGWVAAIAVLVLGYHGLRWYRTQVVFCFVELACLVSAAGSMVHYTWRRTSPRLDHLIVLLLVILEGVASVAYLGNIVTLWPVARVAYAVLYVAISAVEGGWLLWQTLSSRSRSAA